MLQAVVKVEMVQILLGSPLQLLVAEAEVAEILKVDRAVLVVVQTTLTLVVQVLMVMAHLVKVIEVVMAVTYQVHLLVVVVVALAL